MVNIRTIVIEHRNLGEKDAFNKKVLIEVANVEFEYKDELLSLEGSYIIPTEFLAVSIEKIKDKIADEIYKTFQ